MSAKPVPARGLWEPLVMIITTLEKIVVTGTVSPALNCSRQNNAVVNAGPHTHHPDPADNAAYLAKHSLKRQATSTMAMDSPKSIVDDALSMLSFEAKTKLNCNPPISIPLKNGSPS